MGRKRRRSSDIHQQELPYDWGELPDYCRKGMLVRAGFTSTKQTRRLTDEEFRKIPGVGEVTMREVRRLEDRRNRHRE